MDLQLMLFMIVILLESPKGSSSQSPSGPMQGIQGNHTCDFEDLTSCGWTVDGGNDAQGSSGISTSQSRPTLGPSVDASGNQSGQYFYFSSSTLSQSERVLYFPSYVLICGLSFSHYVSGPLDVGLIFENYVYRALYIAPAPNDTTSAVWTRETLSFNTSEPFDGTLYFEVSPYDFGEAPVEPGGYDLFLGLDDISLTFCLPCDYDTLGTPGGLGLVGSNDITIRLRVTSKEVYNGTSSVCPNQPLQYNIESVEPPQVASIFSLDAMTGVLLIHAQGSGLQPSGVQNGRLEISIHIPGSNYSNISPAVHHSMTISFSQPPTITHTAPTTLSVQVGIIFSYQFTVSSALGQTLNFGELTSDPQGLVDDVSIAIAGTEATISGLISLSRDLPIILENNTSPSISIPILDTYGVVVASTQLVIEQSAPLFSQEQYEFSTVEGSTGVRLGPVLIADPNGDTINVPVIAEDAESKLFRVIFGQASGIFTDVYFLADLTLDYERFQEFNFHLIVQDTENISLSSQATVRVIVIPVNEFSPVFQTADYSLDISDVEPRGRFVAEFVAQDHDNGIDGDITYSISAGNDEGFFEIAVPSFGDVSVTRSPILPHTYTLTITATDGGSPALSADAALTVRVVATHTIDCTEPQFGPPTITPDPVSSRVMEVSVGTEMSLTCEYFANPVARVYKWVHIDEGIILESSDHYTVNQHSLVVHNLTVEDAGVYDCNVTNQCGNRTLGYLVNIIDYPDPPLNLEVISGPDMTSVTIIWDPPSISSNTVVLRPLDSFEVWARHADEDDYQTLASVDSNVHRVNVTGLHPGTFYWMVVASINTAGSSLSNAINITTLPSVPKLHYLGATEQSNQSILIVWDLQYSGGSPIVSFEIHVILQEHRAKRASPDLIYHVSVDSGQLVTRSLQSGHSYIVMATLYNSLGSSDEYVNVYVGPRDNLFCDFETPDCFWQLNAGVIATADSIPVTFVNEDSAGNPFGHFVLAGADEETVGISYSKAWYVCGYSFSYQLSHDAVLSLRTTSGNVVWSSSMATSGWVRVSSKGEQFVTSSQEEELQFVLEGTGAAITAIDDAELQFCLPCDFPQLLNIGLNLTYPSNVDLFLRTEQVLSLSADLLDCSAALLEFSLIRVIPSELEPSFSVSPDSPHTASIFISAIPSDRVLPHTPGYIEVSASVVHSDYHPDNSRIETTVLIEFILLSATDNCSLSQGCDFEAECGEWNVGSGVRQLTGAEAPVQRLKSNQGNFLYGDYTSTTLPSSTVTSSRIGDTYCAISFSYSASSTLELVISVGGLGPVWSSLLATNSVDWSYEVVSIDLESVSLSSERELTFSVGPSGDGEMDASLPLYVALDNITVHPCIDCNTPECVFTTCTPGRYFALGEESCVACPQGYYCPDWREFPIPCPPGTFSDVENAASSSVCKSCPSSRYSVTPGSSSCDACPPGYSCVDSAQFPVANDQCSTPITPTTASMLAVIVGAGAGGVALLLCLLLSCVIACWCYKSRKENNNRKKNARVRLLGEDMMSIGSAGSSLGRSSMATMSTFDDHGRRWKKGRDVSTLMSFLSDEDDGGGETSWEDTEQLTDPPGNGHVTSGDDHQTVFKNNAFEGETELADYGNHGDQGNRSAANTSHF